jgi:succinate dehydrogenase / fumarate reductase flavoprotein subunit
LYAIGECDYQYHGANRLGANSLLSCIFSGLIVAPGIETLLKSQTGAPAVESAKRLCEQAQQKHQADHEKLLRKKGGGENPYLIHQELGQIMTKSATVVRHNDVLREALATVRDLEQRARRCSLSDTGHWTNQNVVFTKAVRDMFPLAKAILQGALARDESRGAHYKPEFSMPGLSATDPAEHRREAEQWCDRFEENTKRWLKSTIATCDANGEVTLSYEEVDTTIIPPRPRLYGLVGGEIIEQVWKERLAARSRAGDAAANGTSGSKQAVTV